MSLKNNHEQIITILSREILKKRLAIFVGAGCSMNAGLPSWKQLIDDLIKKYKISTKEENLLKRASRVERAIRRTNLVDEISERCRIYQKENVLLHRLITDLEVNLFITTNYDQLLEDTFRAKGIHPHVLTKDQDLPNIDPTAKTIVKLHGDIDSPSLLVISEKDYREYKINHRGFIDWLKSKNAEMTFLFLGTSFDDPRLLEADDHVLDIFGTNRRNHIIVLKKPEKLEEQDENDFQAEIEDYEDRCHYFETERGFIVLSLQKYDEIQAVLQNLKECVLQANIAEKERSDRYFSLHQLQIDRAETLGRKFTEHLDETVRELCDEIAGPEAFPSFSKVKLKIDQLIDRLQNPPHLLTPETIVHGYITLLDAFTATGRTEDIQRAFDFYNKANLSLPDVENGQELALRVTRSKAKLLLFQGELAAALELVQNDATPKGIFWRLVILTAADQLEEALSLIQKYSPPQLEWGGAAISVLIKHGEIEEAEQIYEKFVSEPGPFHDGKGNGLIRMQDQMARAYLHRALMLEGNPDLLQVLPGKLSPNADAACKKAIRFVEKIEEYLQVVNPNDNLIFAGALVTKMHALYLIGETVLSIKYAKKLLGLRPIIKEVAQYFLLKGDPAEDREAFISLAVDLLEDYSQEDWAGVARVGLLHLAGQSEEAWQFMVSLKDKIVTEKYKKQLALIILELGGTLQKRDIANAMIDELIDEDDPFYKYLQAKEFMFQKLHDQAYAILKNLQDSFLEPFIQSDIFWLMASIHLERKQWSLAKELLQKSVSKLNHPQSLRALIKLGFKQNDDAAALDAALKLEQLGLHDDEIIKAKAQAAYNLGRFSLSYEVWKDIFNKEKTPEHAVHLAQVLRVMTKEDDALAILIDYIPDGGPPDLKCLGHYCDILQAKGKYEDAFRMLNSQFEHIQDSPELLIMHLNLAYRVGQETSAQESIMRLIELKEQGKVDERLFRPVNPDDFNLMLQSSRQTREKALEQYRLGSYPRAFICSFTNKPYYLDWAIRTQEYFPQDPKERLDYTVYSTNYLRLATISGKTDLVPIKVPKDATEVVIDLSALITIHRTDLFPFMEKRFQAIYYPQALHWLWDSERPHYTYHQRAKELLYKEILTYLTSEKIKTLSLPAKVREDGSNKGIILLAQTKNLPIITAWSKNEEWAEAGDITVFRMQHLINWLYQSGKIGENKYRECLALFKDELSFIEDTTLDKLQSTERLLFEQDALEFLIENDLLKPLASAGLRPVIDESTAWYFKRAVSELQFLEKVGKWQQDLEAAIKASKVFKPFHHSPPESEGNFYITAILESVKFCQEKNLDLMTDDRFMYRISQGDWTARQFGTDTLLQEFFERDKFSLDQYARYFLDLVRWRYRFLVPDFRVLLYFIRQYKHRPLGKELDIIADYARHCMEDPGLFLGPEPTDPPKPLGAVLYLKWIDAWTKLLCEIWLDDDFDMDSLYNITRKVLGRAVPPPPKGLNQEMRERLGAIEDKIVTSKLIEFIMDSSKALKLHNLLKEAFQNYSLNDESKQVSIIREHFQMRVRIARSEGFRQDMISKARSESEKSELIQRYENLINDEVLGKSLARILVAYYGDMQIPTPSPFMDLLEEFGLDAKSAQDAAAKESELHILSEPLEEKGRIERKDAVISSVDGPIYKVEWKEKAEEEYTILHNILDHPESYMREKAYQELMKPGKLTTSTRDKLKELKNALMHDLRSKWEPAAYEVSQTIIKDFRYARKLLAKALLWRVSDEDLLNNVLTSLFYPNLETVWDEVPPVVKTPELNPEMLVKKTITQFKSALKDNNPIEKALDLYMELFGFVPLAPRLDAWSVIEPTIKIIFGSDKSTPFKTVNDAKEYVDNVSKWAETQNDPLALVAAWQALLGAASSTADIPVFNSSEFKNILTRIFIDLASPMYRTGVQKENERRAFLEKAWATRVKFAHHYLRYLEMEAQESSDLQRVLEAWWMAQKATKVAIESIDSRSVKEKTKILEEYVIHEWIDNMTRPYEIRHIFNLSKSSQSVDSYCTYMSSSFLPAAAMAFIMPSSKTVSSLGFPGMVMTDAIRDAMVSLLESPADYFLAHLPRKESTAVALSWNIPMVCSIPLFLREYYKENLEFIGKRKMNLIRYAEEFSRPVDLDAAFERILKLNDKSLVLHAAFAFDVVRLKLVIEGSVDQSLKIIRTKTNLLNKLIGLDPTLGLVSAILLARMLPWLYVKDEKIWVKAIEEQLLALDWEKAVEYAEPLVESIILAALLGEENILLKEIVGVSRKFQEFKKALNLMKKYLDNSLNHVPFSFRNKVRYLLRELEILAERQF